MSGLASCPSGRRSCFLTSLWQDSSAAVALLSSGALLSDPTALPDEVIDWVLDLCTPDSIRAYVMRADGFP